MKREVYESQKPFAGESIAADAEARPDMHLLEVRVERAVAPACDGDVSALEDVRLHQSPARSHEVTIRITEDTTP